MLAFTVVAEFPVKYWAEKRSNDVVCVQLDLVKKKLDKCKNNFFLIIIIFCIIERNFGSLKANEELNR